MTIVIDGCKYYRTNEACRLAGISKNTYLRWVREGVLVDVQSRDRRGWRIFTDKDLKSLISESQKITTAHGWGGR